ncbi:MAG: hypothetical protein BroJett029_30600 [Alphaproteobacteria bacterium]|nr:MAG: hypothetical protein BroJett029_30600 [Alphaproteobacteria bacterium]
MSCGARYAVSPFADSLWSFAILGLLPLTILFGWSGDAGAIFVCVTGWLVLLGAWILMPLEAQEPGDDAGTQTTFRGTWSWKSPTWILVLTIVIAAGLLAFAYSLPLSGSTLAAIRLIAALLAVALVLHLMLHVPLRSFLSSTDRAGARLARSTGHSWLSSPILLGVRIALFAGLFWMLFQIS